MIEQLDNKYEETSCKIHSLFQASCRIEAALLGVIDFPPLKRKLVDFLNSDNKLFYGLFRNKEIAAIVELRNHAIVMDIESLLIHPEYFRQGLGRQLMQFILQTNNSVIFTVETGLKNEPAIKLYKQLGFREQKQLDTDFGIRKIRFIKRKKENFSLSPVTF